MTVIAWDGKTLAADKRACYGSGTIRVTKIFRLGESLVGFAGDTDRVGLFLEWLSSDRDPAKYPPNEKENGNSHVSALVIRRDGTIERYARSGYPAISEMPFDAIGSGAAYALAAMHLGRTAAEAVAVACEFDEACGHGCDTLSFEVASGNGTSPHDGTWELLAPFNPSILRPETGSARPRFATEEVE